MERALWQRRWHWRQPRGSGRCLPRTGDEPTKLRRAPREDGCRPQKSPESCQVPTWGREDCREAHGVGKPQRLSSCRPAPPTLCSRHQGGVVSRRVGVPAPRGHGPGAETWEQTHGTDLVGATGSEAPVKQSGRVPLVGMLQKVLRPDQQKGSHLSWAKHIPGRGVSGVTASRMGRS